MFETACRLCLAEIAEFDIYESRINVKIMTLLGGQLESWGEKFLN